MQATFLCPLTSNIKLLISLAVSFVNCTLFLVGNGIMKKESLQTYLKLFGGISIAMVLFSVIMVYDNTCSFLVSPRPIPPHTSMLQEVRKVVRG